MIKLKLKQTALLLVLTLVASMATAQTVNMSKKITLTVQQGQQIQLDLKAAAEGTPVKIVSGSNKTAVTVGTNWTGFRNYTAGAGTMTVYGDITEFDCSGNGTKLTALDVSYNTALTTLLCWGNQLTSLDVSHNTALKYLRCYGNSFTTRAFNYLMCSLPTRTTADNAKFYPLWNASDAAASAFMATNSQIAIAKNWQVRYYEGSEDEIPATTGTYPCPTANMNKYITLTVTQGEQIQLRFQAAAEGTPVKIVSGSTEQTITVDTSWTGYRNYTAGSTTMTVYGDITEFGCGGNGTKLTALDVSQNTALTGLSCSGNQLTSLDVSQNRALTGLYCTSNQLTSLDVSQNRALTELWCNGNQLTALDVSQNTALTTLYCYDNQLTSLDVSQNTALIKLECYNNQLTSLDVSRNTALTRLYCSGNQLTSLDVSQNTALIKLVCSNNQLTSLDVSQNTALTELYCSNNQLTSLDVSQNTALTELYCSGNQLTSLDVSRNTALTWLNCRSNQLTSLDVSRNTSLTRLGCWGNNFTVQAFNDLMCSLSARTAADDVAFYPLWNASDAKYAAFMAANSQIAIAKNWQVLYGADETAVPATNGMYVCGGGSGSVNMSKYITLTVQQGEQISLDLKAAAAGTGVKVVSGSTEQTITVGTDWTDFQNYTAVAGTMTVYGDIAGFDCSENEAKLTALDASQNTALTELYCYDNQLTSLDVSQNTALTWLNCGSNQLTSLDVSRNTALTALGCWGNNFTVQAFNDLMCSLLARTTADDAKFYPLYSASDAAAAAFMASNSQIATAKNWQVLYGADGAAVPATNGTYTCPVIGIAEVASVPLAVYPNPATDILTVETETTGAAITLTDLTGRTVASATATATAGETTLNIARLSAGTYIVRVGNRVGKIVKR